MTIDELIERLEAMADGERWAGSKQNAELLKLAAETIQMLWDVAKDTTNEKYRMKFDEVFGGAE